MTFYTDRDLSNGELAYTEFVLHVRRRLESSKGKVTINNDINLQFYCFLPLFMINNFLLEWRQLGLNDDLFGFLRFSLSLFLSIQLSVKVNEWYWIGHLQTCRMLEECKIYIWPA